MNPNPLIEAAGLVADGVVFDWGSMSSRLSTGAERAIADELAGVARIADAHRHLHQLLPATATDHAASISSRSSWGHLELLEIVGRGSYGTVYRAWDSRLDRQVALKLFHGTHDREAVLREGRMLARIRHDNVVAVYGADVSDGVAGIWMEFVKGRSLDQFVKERGPLSAQEATLVGLDMSRALAAVHGAGLLHCDVKAQNVVREPGGRLVLMDLGAGRSVPSPGDSTHDDDLTGTPHYMAPELFARRPASPQSDLYSLGVLLFYLVSGRFPADGKTLAEIRQAHVQQRLRHLRDLRPDLPTGYLREVTRALDPDPLARHHSAGELEAGLLRLSPASPSGSARGSLSPTSWKAVPVWFAATTVATIVGLVLAGAWFTGRSLPSAGAARSIAVLPIRNLTGDASKNYLADGLTEVLISNLARVRMLRVPSFAAVAPFRGESAATRDTANRLGVGLLLAGSIVEADSTVRITVQLIDPGADSVLWAEELTRPSTEMLGAQVEIARMVAARLSVDLSSEEQGALTSAAVDPAAQEAFLRGLVSSQAALSRAALETTVQHFHAATRLAPGFAPAWAQLALAESALLDRSSDVDRRRQAAYIKDLAYKAIAIDPTLSTAHAALGSVQFYYDWDFAAADRTFNRAMELNPSDSFVAQQYAMLLAALGRVSEAIPLAQRARDLEPLVPVRSTNVGILFYYARDYETAEREMRRALEISPSFAAARYGLGRALSAQGQITEAIDEVQEAVARSNSPAYLAELSRVLAASGKRSEADAIQSQLVERRRKGEAFGLDHAAYFAIVDSRIDDAFRILNEAIDERQTNVLWIAVDPRVDAIRQDLRFHQLLVRIGLKS